MWYFVDHEGRIMSTSNRDVDRDEVARSGMTQIWSDNDIPLPLADVHGYPHSPRIVERREPADDFERARQIKMETDAADADGDGRPEVPADGVTAATITAWVADSPDKPLREGLEVHFRTTRGILSARSAPLRGGKATVRLTSSLETVSVGVYASAEGCRPAALYLEFIPRQG